MQSKAVTVCVGVKDAISNDAICMGLVGDRTMRTIKPKRDPKTGVFFHYCPDSGIRPNERIGYKVCEMCPHNINIERKPQSYVVHCNAPDTYVALAEFEPPKAHETYRGLKGLNILKAVYTHNWIEPKLDGVRALVHLMPFGVIITSRRRSADGHYTRLQDNVPHLRDHPGLVALGKKGCTVLDGELIVPGDGDTLARTMGVVGSKPDHAVAVQRNSGVWAELHLFDVAHSEKFDVTTTPLYTRYKVLRGLMESIPTPYYSAYYKAYDTAYDIATTPLKVVEHHYVKDEPEARRLYVDLLEQGYEGCIMKNPSAGYLDSMAWLKVKQRTTVDAMVTGWEPGSKGGKYMDTLGALRVSVFTPDGEMREIARVTPGNDQLRGRLYNTLSTIGQDNEQGFMELAMVIELEAQGWTKDFRLRHPRVLRYRPDKGGPNTVDFSEIQTL